LKNEEEKCKEISSENASPIIKTGMKKLNKENNLDEINPVSERGSYSSIYANNIRANRDRKHILPSYKNTLKEMPMNQLSNMSYNENSYDLHQSMPIHQFQMQNPNMRNILSCTNKACKNRD